MTTQRSVIWTLATVCYMGGIFYLSSLSGNVGGLVGPSTRSWGLVWNATHIPLFAGLGICLAMTLAHWRWTRRAAWTLAAGVGYAIFDEWHQSWVPARSASVSDVLLDGIGLALGLVTVRLLSRRRVAAAGTGPRITVRTRLVRTAAELAGLAPVWAELNRQAGQVSPFLSHDWFSCCWNAVAPGRSAEVVVIEEAGSSVALVPLMRWTERRHGLSVRCLGFLDCPDTAMLDFVGAGESSQVVEAFLEHLESRGDWDVAVLQKLPASSATLKALEAGLPGRLPWRRAGTLLSPYLAIAGRWELFYGTRTQRFKKTVRNIQNRLERAGRVSVEQHRDLDPSGPLFHEVVELTRRSWKADRGVALATMPRMPEFFRELTRRATARQWLSVWLLRLDSRPIAMEYQLQADGKVHALRADYDMAYRELSPGSALNFAIVRALFEGGGVHEYDMGPGLNEYKLRWASETHETTTLQIYRASLYGRLLHLLETAIVPAARRWRGRAR